MKFIATTSNKLGSIPFIKGQMIFSRDDRVIYLDSDTRTPFPTFITILNEDARNALPYPMEGFYFVEQEHTFWRFYANKWFLIAGGKENYFYPEKIAFPMNGEEDKLYIDKETNNVYIWNEKDDEYHKINPVIWENF